MIFIICRQWAGLQLWESWVGGLENKGKGTSPDMCPLTSVIKCFQARSNYGGVEHAHVHRQHPGDCDTFHLGHM